MLLIYKHNFGDQGYVATGRFHMLLTAPDCCFGFILWTEILTRGGGRTLLKKKKNTRVHVDRAGGISAPFLSPLGLLEEQSLCLDLRCVRPSYVQDS